MPATYSQFSSENKIGVTQSLFNLKIKINQIFILI